MKKKDSSRIFEATYDDGTVVISGKGGHYQVYINGSEVRMDEVFIRFKAGSLPIMTMRRKVFE